jgi:putative flippase GtrA
MWKKNVLDKIGMENIISKGYSFQVEMKYRAWIAGCMVKEIPITFTDRKFGKSKMSEKILFEALLNIWKIKSAVCGNTVPMQFIKFSLTGGFGTITNLVIFFLCVDKAGLPEIPVSIGCFLIAGTQNYIINNKWSFAEKSIKTQLSIKQWFMFLFASLLGLTVNIAVMKLIIVHYTLPYKFIAQACGIAAGMAINFALSKLFIWRRNT